MRLFIIREIHVVSEAQERQVKIKENSFLFPTWYKRYMKVNRIEFALLSIMISRESISQSHSVKEEANQNHL